MSKSCVTCDHSIHPWVNPEKILLAQVDPAAAPFQRARFCELKVSWVAISQSCRKFERPVRRRD